MNSRSRWIKLVAVGMAASVLSVGCSSDEKTTDSAKATSTSAAASSAAPASSAAASADASPAASSSAAADTSASASPSEAAASSAPAESAAPAVADDGTGGKKVTLKVNFWGDFGLDALAKKYTELHPNVTIKLNTGDYNQQHQDLQKFLVAGSGAPDISAIDEGFMVQFKNQADKFVNLADKGGADYESKYLDWKWKQAQGPNGEILGLGTDVGGQAMCYRKDLFEAAGLPADREAVSALWPDWDAFIETGKKYSAGSGGKKMVDSATNVFNPVLAQQPVGYFDESEKLTMEPGAKTAFDTAVKMIDAGISANLASFTPEWNAAFKNGKFATLACPAWMMGYIQGQAPDTKGKWDVAAIPGGGGNWGGSWLTVPAQGKNIDASVAFIKFLVEPENQIAVFQKVGNLPSQPALYDDPKIKDFKSEFFNNAPTGVIFSETAKNLKPQYLGKNNSKVRTAVENVLRRVDSGKLKGGVAFAEAIKEAEKANK